MWSPAAWHPDMPRGKCGSLAAAGPKIGCSCTRSGTCSLFERKALPGHSLRASVWGMGRACCPAGGLLHGAALTCARRSSAACVRGVRDSCCPDALLGRSPCLKAARSGRPGLDVQPVGSAVGAGRVREALTPCLCPALQAACQLGGYMFKPSGAAMLRPLALAALVAAAVLLTTATARCAGWGTPGEARARSD